MRALYDQFEVSHFETIVTIVTILHTEQHRLVSGYYYYFNAYYDVLFMNSNYTISYLWIVETRSRIAAHIALDLQLCSYNKWTICACACIHLTQCECNAVFHAPSLVLFSCCVFVYFLLCAQQLYPVRLLLFEREFRGHTNIKLAHNGLGCCCCWRQ